jgi:hypothetical protein
MTRAYTIREIKFEGNYMMLVIDNQLIRVNLAEISEKLAHATPGERNDYKISPSGYGIHWNLLDEDLSVNGLLKNC